MKNPLTPTGIEPATFRFVAQHLNHCATAVPKHVESYKYKFEKLVLLVGFIVRIYHNAWSSECQIQISQKCVLGKHSRTPPIRTLFTRTSLAFQVNIFLL